MTRRTPLVDAALDRAVTIPSATVHAHVDQLRRKHPDATPQRLVELLEREYLLLVQGTGGAVGAAAAAPAVGTGVALALTLGDVATFFGASAAFSLAVASVHGIDVQDAERRRALLLATILGETGVKAAADAGGIRTVSVARALLTRMPTGTIRRVNTRLTRQLFRRQLARQSGLALGRLVPFGVGAVVGVTGARALARTVIEGAQQAFGPAPASFGDRVVVVETGAEPRLLPEGTPAPPRTPAD
ncbi:hypothetical protein [Cellulomonas sp. C5510]|uniref:hypothetical protein n=1 Tax=Cellulomonas sp. C5510 TaxID=2871170 RepID=UPI001C97585B|nr:hypothetical protein [Cellulomonas sp. C5510]QZN86186.1 hypothetical protein K5O09_03015 [Cellulomonas sp. C5510]